MTKIKTWTPSRLIEILVENPKGFLDQQEIKLPEKFVYVLGAERYMAKVYLNNGVPTVAFDLWHSKTTVVKPLQLVDSDVIFEEFVICATQN